MIAGRAAATYNDGAAKDHLAEFIRNARVTHIVVAHLASPDFQSDRSVLDPFVQENRNMFTEIYANPAFVVYKVIPLADRDSAPVAPAR
ncbi:MAG: hypothetical protein EXQ47_10085 [Bryobacterales bacterium]|nr:hypothetical protein [Bryobacterales bacterium]